MRRKIFRGFIVLLLLLVILYFELITYGIRQGIGQGNILWNTQSPTEFLAQSEYPDSVKVYFEKKIKLIKNIKRFAVDSLGLEDNGNYERIFDQKDKPILWAVSASKPFALEPHTWNYGPLGEMPYKGYFDAALAQKLVSKLKKDSLDVNIYNPAAWSTLGWFRDPILSDMLYWSEGGLASLIIHEMTHGTIWIRGDVPYNENLADFIGDQGTKHYLTSKYGTESTEYQDFINRQIDSEKFYEHILNGAEQLDKLYQSFGTAQSNKEKTRKKQAFIQKIIQTLDTVSFAQPEYYQNAFKEEVPNNAFFMAYKRYREKQDDFTKVFQQQFKKNLRAYIEFLKNKHPA